MKEFYVSPEVEVTCFAPVENIAGDLWDQEQSGLFSTRNTNSPVIENPIDGTNGEMDPEE